MKCFLFCSAIALLSLSQAAQINVDVTHKVIFDIASGSRHLGTVTIALFGKQVPNTVNNFVTLASSGVQGRSYRGSRFHRVIPNFMIQGGDVVRGDGTGSISIFGNKFQDESFDILHSEGGLLSMANSGPDTNGSQFFITTVPTAWLNGKHVVFGKVIDGLEVVQAIERLPTNAQKRPLEDVMITRSEVMPVQATLTLNQ